MRRRRGGSRGQILRHRDSRRIERFVDRRFGSGGNRTAIPNFPLIDVDHFLERRTVFVCHRQLIFERMLLFGGLRHFLPQPSEVADAVAFFAGAQSNYVTGQVLSVSGGLTMVG